MNPETETVFFDFLRTRQLTCKLSIGSGKWQVAICREGNPIAGMESSNLTRAVRGAMEDYEKRHQEANRVLGEAQEHFGRFLRGKKHDQHNCS